MTALTLLEKVNETEDYDQQSDNASASPFQLVPFGSGYRLDRSTEQCRCLFLLGESCVWGGGTKEKRIKAD